MTSSEMNEFSLKSTMSVKAADMPCPFRLAADPDARCNKKGGVCSLRQYREDALGKVTAQGGFVTMCPNRFWAGNKVFEWIGKDLVDSQKPIIVREVDFLETPGVDEAKDTEATADAVGRIDMVLMNAANELEWCTVEVQAVYFSGKKMAAHLDQFAVSGLNGMPFPDAIRRPDFRSSGPKRLMPQLQTKVPTLRRWGKKMAVIIDVSFANSLGAFTKISHLSNCDIVWYVVDYDQATGEIVLDRKILTTLESSVEALTAGVPRSREEFEGKLKSILKGTMGKKVVRFS